MRYAKECPCRYCVPPKRHSGCHATCPDYKEWNEEHQKELEAFRKSRDEDTEYIAMVSYHYNRRRKKHGYHSTDRY